MDFFDNKQFNTQDANYICGLKNHDEKIIHQFFYHEISGILHKIRAEVFHIYVDFDELVNELYLYISQDEWSKLDGFVSKNNCCLRTWIIPVAWRFFIKLRENLITSDINSEVTKDIISTNDLRIQIAIDVNATLSKMPNKRYSEIIRLLLIEGYAALDVADMLDMRVENVYNLKHRAITQFIEL